MSHVAVVNFRTMANGSFEYMRNKRRGYWRVLIVKDPRGPLTLRSRNVIGEHYVGQQGIDGVTPRSRYYIGDELSRCVDAKDEYNASVS